MIDGAHILERCYRILQFLIVWGFFNIPAKICPQKQIFEMQIKNYEEKIQSLSNWLEKPVANMDQMATLQITRTLDQNLVREIENTDDLLSLFSQKQTGKVELKSQMARWTCESCNYSNHPEEAEKKCTHCGKPRPEIQVIWFPD